MIKSKLRGDIIGVIKFMERLSDRDRILLIERFGRNKTLKEVAKQFKLSEAGVKMIEDELLDELKELMLYHNL